MLRRLARCLLLALLVPWSPSAGAPALAFFENLHFQVLQGDSLLPGARLYDAEDFQSLLLVRPEGPPLLLDLTTDAVYELDSTAVSWSGAEGEPVLEGREGALPVGVLEKGEDGTVRILLDGEPQALGLAPAPPLVGPVSREELLRVKPVYAEDARKYHPREEAVAELASLQEPVEILVFFGTWCRLCKRLLPKLLAVLDAADNPRLQVRFVGVDEELEEPAELIERHAVGATPTIIFLKGGREVGRIEETAEPSIEEEMVEILLGR
jgi:thiol-disulfide isomerase/thioredoxin